jgi:uncharacterized OB-fold protein
MSGARLIDESLFVEVDGRTQLAGSTCRACGAVSFPAQGSCPRCTGTDVSRVPLPTEGSLWAFTVQRFPPKTPFLGADAPFTPYAVGYVDLAGLVLVESRIVVDDPDELRIGQPVRLVLDPFFSDEAGEIQTYAFTPTGAAHG